LILYYNQKGMEFKEGKPINTSKSNSSDPASGSKIYGSASIPDAVVFDGGTETTTDSGLRVALCPAAWNEQFLGKVISSVIGNGNKRT
jgi:hypothetical protein